MNGKLVANHQIYLHTENWVGIGFKIADWRPSVFVKDDTICQFSKFHCFLFIIYIHHELKTCGKSSNLSAHKKLG